MYEHNSLGRTRAESPFPSWALSLQRGSLLLGNWLPLATGRFPPFLPPQLGLLLLPLAFLKGPHPFATCREGVWGEGRGGMGPDLHLLPKGQIPWIFL